MGVIMSLDKKLLAQAKSELVSKRKLHEEQYELRLENIYQNAPKVREIELQIRETMSELFSVAMSADADSRIAEFQAKNLSLQNDLRTALLDAGYDENALYSEYMCDKCRDTGYFGTRICDCLLQIYKKKLNQSLSNLLRLGDEDFARFDLSYYDGFTASGGGVSPRSAMEVILGICKDYAYGFGKNSLNLFFVGSTGLGKTFLSACIARVVADSGFSVVYDTAGVIFDKFGDAKFLRAPDPEDARSEIRRFLECDLLILDDLGTEMTTAFTVSALYEIINTRLVTGRKTIVSSNLTLNEMRRRYSEQIASRLEGEYQVLIFRGEDIRLKKNMV